jgi:GMP synthase (glutamine-hydrolysing)
LKRNIYGVQFHPEVEHTQHGLQILKNFAKLVCRLNLRPKKLDVQAVINRVRAQADLAGKNSRAISAVSGGVDSTVASAIVAKAIGNRFTPVFCDNGLMRLGTRDEVNFIFKDLLHVKPTIIHCQTQFLKALKGVTDPEQKRKLIGKLYIQNFEKEANKIGDIHWLVQGTIYSDVIESQGTKHSSKIKSHHNVGGLPKRIQLRLLEPVRDFYKDEVRELGRQLGLPKAVVNKEPFPGPGQAIRIIGEITNKRLQTHQHADQIVTEELDKSGWRDRVFQGFPILTGIKSTAVKGDDRVYGEVIALRIFGSNDIMTAGWLHLPYDVLQTISTRIVNEIPGVSRVVYDITTKPPATMEWE